MSTMIVTAPSHPLILRGYQNETVVHVDTAWLDPIIRNIIVTLPTGAGKTKLMAYFAKRHHDRGGYGVAIAHRSVLVAQLSMALAEAGVPHDIIASKDVVKTIVGEHMEDLGRSFYVPGARFKVVSVDTMKGRAPALSSWIKLVTLGFTDEAHHVLEENKWGRECNRFDNPMMRWLLPTATPERADGKGLGRAAHGIADVIVKGPTMPWLIDHGYLTRFVVRGVIPSDLDLSKVDIGPNGEYNLQQLRKAIHGSKKIIGSVVDTYKRLTPNKLGIVFAVDISHAQSITDEFNAKGVPCELITGEEDEDSRRKKLKRYRKRETLVLVNVDLFGEGFDLPSIEVVMMARPTASYALFAQQFGRGLRIGVDKAYLEHWERYTVEERLAIITTSSKPVALIHDHVGNVLHFGGPPTVPREFTLDSTRRSGGPSDAIPLRICLSPTCLQPFERFYTHCPYCGFNVPPPPLPTLPEQVDGDLVLYTPEMLWKLFKVTTVQAALAIQPDAYVKIPPTMTSLAEVRARQANHNKMILAQRELSALMPLTMPPRYSERENQRRFFHHYGMDVVQTRLLTASATEELISRIKNSLTVR
jgi:superfamily II DNA or RNA helicase